MSISRVALENFQKHASLDVSFSSGVTAIIGDSDTGKSSLLRAVRWAALNQPRGIGFKRKDSGDEALRVRLRVDDQTVKRERVGSKNAYSLRQKEYRAFSSDVPPDIASFLNVSELNFSGQHDSIFWLSLSPGELAKRLNEIVDLEIIDRTVADLESRKRATKTETEVVKARLSEANRQVARTFFAVAMDKKLIIIEHLQEEATEVRTKANAMLEIVQFIRKQTIQAEKLQGRSAAGHVALDAARVAGRLGTSVSGLRSVIEQIRQLQSKVSVKIPDIQPLERMWSDCLAVRSSVGKMTDLVKQIRQQKMVVEQNERRKREAEEKFHSQIQGACPLCGAELSGTKLIGV